MKAKELLDIIEDHPIFEMSNLYPKKTGIDYIIHIRTQIETPSHKETPTLKIYQSSPGGNTPNFTLIISDHPEIPKQQISNKFYSSIKSRDLKKIKEWVKLNKELLLEFYFNGSQWETEQILAWEKKLKKVK